MGKQAEESGLPCEGELRIFRKNELVKPDLRNKYSIKLTPAISLRSLFGLLIMAAICVFLVNNYETETGMVPGKKDKDKLVSAPLGFITLRATRVPEGVRLSWIDKFGHEDETVELERSIGNENFLSLGKVMEEVLEEEFQPFTYVDSLQRQEEIVYRLKKTDPDGDMMHSLPIRVGPLYLDFDFSLSTNSRGNEVLVYVKKNREPKVVDFAVWDMDGILVFDKRQKISSGQSDFRLKTGHLKSGVYFVTSTEDGIEKTGSRKFIVP